VVNRNHLPFVPLLSKRVLRSTFDKNLSIEFSISEHIGEPAASKSREDTSANRFGHQSGTALSG